MGDGVVERLEVIAGDTGVHMMLGVPVHAPVEELRDGRQRH